MDWKLEVVVLPVTDVDRAKSFYVEQMGFHLDVDVQPTEAMRVVQMTPPGSTCSVTIGPNIFEPTDTPRVSAALQLVVTDIEAARTELLGRGVDVGEIQVLDPRDGGKFLFFADPDGNGWAIQEIRVAAGTDLS
jgi:catechol 2,3-dioxygenase-like lactoylglutathione lyase family enzyme